MDGEKGGREREKRLEEVISYFISSAIALPLNGEGRKEIKIKDKEFRKEIRRGDRGEGRIEGMGIKEKKKQ